MIRKISVTQGIGMAKSFYRPLDRARRCLLSRPRRMILATACTAAALLQSAACAPVEPDGTVPATSYSSYPPTSYYYPPAYYYAPAPVYAPTVESLGPYTVAGQSRRVARRTSRRQAAFR